MPDKLATHVGIKSEFDKRGTGLVQIIVAICFGWKVWGYGEGVDSICVCVSWFPQGRWQVMKRRFAQRPRLIYWPSGACLVRLKSYVRCFGGSLLRKSLLYKTT